MPERTDSGFMDALLKETVNATVSSHYPGMTPEGRKLIEGILIRKEAEKGEILLKEGQISHNIVIVGKGMLRQFYYKNGKDLTEHFSYEGCIIICIESTLKQEPTRLMIEALEPSIVYLLPYNKLLMLTEMSWEVNMFYRKILEKSLITSQVKADSWRFETARERYNRLMASQPEVVKRAPLLHIASYLLMTPETLSRVRSGAL
ncbi:CRP-like cAMP-binding protein [Bacteroides heparinolyticus]|uniref:CRP-like cAMP-binding protein n=2 Tax=Prevotella heparinolytica TaxID=28113 RepID=A0A4R2M193_9BACE|nr:CRP-like cAMP-binding protein [Bacteroides heparinolyticus]